MTGARSTPRGLAEQDATALLGTAAVISALLLAGQLDARTTDQVRLRFVSVGLLPEQSGPEHLLVALNGMTDRLRYALGEYPDPPVPPDGSGFKASCLPTASQRQLSVFRSGVTKAQVTVPKKLERLRGKTAGESTYW